MKPEHPSSPISFSRLLALASFALVLLPTILDTLSTDIGKESDLLSLLIAVVLRSSQTFQTRTEC